MTTYQRSTPRLASSTFVSDVQQLARELHATVPRDDSDSAFLQDIARGRYQMVAMQRLIEIAARSPRPEHHEILSEIVRPRSAASPCVSTAFGAETESTGPADVAQREYELAPCKSTWQRARQALIRQLASTRMALDALHANRIWQ